MKCQSCGRPAPSYQTAAGNITGFPMSGCECGCRTFIGTTTVETGPSAMVREAARYRWLREQVRTKEGRLKAQALFWRFESRKQFDAAIDAEIALAAAPLSHGSEPDDQKP